jgi:Tfp pilus assembly protein PilN
MALHLNLYHEIQKQQLERARDPLKLGMAVMVVMAAILMAYYFFRVQQVYRLHAQAVRLQTEWKVKEPKAQEAKKREQELMVNTQLKEDLVRRIESRFYWAPMFEKILHTVPANVQVTSLQGIMEPDTRAGTLNISGIAGDDSPRRAAEDFRTAFLAKCLSNFKETTSKFSALDETEEKAQLGGKALNTAIFSLQFQFSAKADAPAAAVPAQKPKKARP